MWLNKKIEMKINKEQKETRKKNSIKQNSILISVLIYKHMCVCVCILYRDKDRKNKLYQRRQCEIDRKEFSL